MSIRTQVIETQEFSPKLQASSKAHCQPHLCKRQWFLLTVTLKIVEIYSFISQNIRIGIKSMKKTTSSLKRVYNILKI